MTARLVVDGYNVIHAWDDLKALLGRSLEQARDELAGRLAVYSYITGWEVTLVFDAHLTTGNPGSKEIRDGVEVVFTRSGSSADHAIERLAFEARERGESLMVATSDRFHRDMLRGMGAGVIDALELRRQVQDAEAEMTRRLKEYQAP